MLIKSSRERYSKRNFINDKAILMKQTVGIFYWHILLQAVNKTAAKVNGVYGDGADSIALQVLKGLNDEQLLKQYKNKNSLVWTNPVSGFHLKEVILLS
jgi:hypothetical protein